MTTAAQFPSVGNVDATSDHQRLPLGLLYPAQADTVEFGVNLIDITQSLCCDLQRFGSIGMQGETVINKCITGRPRLFCRSARQRLDGEQVKTIFNLRADVGAVAGMPGCTIHMTTLSGFARTARIQFGAEASQTCSVMELARFTQLLIGQLGLYWADSRIPGINRISKALRLVRLDTAYDMDAPMSEILNCEFRGRLRSKITRRYAEDGRPTGADTVRKGSRSKRMGDFDAYDKAFDVKRKGRSAYASRGLACAVLEGKNVSRFEPRLYSTVLREQGVVSPYDLTSGALLEAIKRVTAQIRMVHPGTPQKDRNTNRYHTVFWARFLNTIGCFSPVVCRAAEEPKWYIAATATGGTITLADPSTGVVQAEHALDAESFDTFLATAVGREMIDPDQRLHLLAQMRQLSCVDHISAVRASSESCGALPLAHDDRDGDEVPSVSAITCTREMHSSAEAHASPNCFGPAIRMYAEALTPRSSLTRIALAVLIGASKGSLGAGAVVLVLIRGPTRSYAAQLLSIVP